MFDGVMETSSILAGVCLAVVVHVSLIKVLYGEKVD